MISLTRHWRVVAQSAWTIMSKQPVCTSSYAMVRALEELEKNPYFEKYAGKIAKVQRESPEEFLSKFAKSKTVKESKSGGPGFTEKAKVSKDSLPKDAFAPQKKLDSILKIDLLKDKTNEELKYIWTEHFRNKDAVSGIIPADTYWKLYETGAKYTTAYKENAPECLTIVHYPDLKEERGIVFMQGEYDKNIINAFEAQFLVNQLQLYYGGNDKVKKEILERFHHMPDQFKHTELINQLESLDLSSLSIQDKPKKHEKPAE
nr:ATP synthase mitochondrial F1 complex assembly factor 1-like isoform X2 [Procambarus clarkii]